MIRTQLFTVELAPQTISCTVSSRLSCVSFFITVPSITAALVGLSVASVCLLCALYKHNAWAIITKASRDSPWWSLGKLLSQCDSEVKWSWLGSDYGWDGRTSSVCILIQMHIFLVFSHFFGLCTSVSDFSHFHPGKGMRAVNLCTNKILQF